MEILKTITKHRRLVSAITPSLNKGYFWKKYSINKKSKL